MIPPEEQRRILETYPTVKHAVSWVEVFLVGTEHEGEISAWQIMMTTVPSLTPDEVVDMIKHSIEGETVGKAEEARKEMDHPEFRQYVLGKMGCY